VTEGRKVVWMVREAVAMVAVEVGGVKAVETEVGAMVADWGEVAKVEEEKAAAKVAFVEVLVVVA